MSTETITLSVKARKPGKAASRALRREKMVPAIVYGSKLENQMTSIDELSVTRYSGRGHENSIFKLNSDNPKLNGVSVLMKDISVHPVTRRPEHVDFYAVDMTATVKVSVEINFEGKPKGVVEEGGLLQILLRNVEVECLPTDIPESLTADVSGLALNDVLHISDLNLPSGVKSTAQEDLALASVTQQKQADEPKAEEAAPAADAAPAEEKK